MQDAFEPATLASSVTAGVSVANFPWLSDGPALLQGSVFVVDVRVENSVVFCLVGPTRSVFVVFLRKILRRPHRGTPCGTRHDVFCLRFFLFCF